MTETNRNVACVSIPFRGLGFGGETKTIVIGAGADHANFEQRRENAALAEEPLRFARGSPYQVAAGRSCSSY